MIAASSRCLLLNATYEPLSVIPWKRAVTMMFLGKVEVVRNYTRDIRSVSVTIKMPSVVRLVRFVRRKRPQVSFSRRNIFARDNFTCQYCRTQHEAAELTYDHVVPRSQGGKTDWDNIVTCCVECNRKKGGRTPEQAHMQLVRRPRRPEALGSVTFTLAVRNAPASWTDFLSWHLQFNSA